VPAAWTRILLEATNSDTLIEMNVAISHVNLINPLKDVDHIGKLMEQLVVAI
jgi:hypothetical protein